MRNGFNRRALLGSLGGVAAGGLTLPLLGAGPVAGPGRIDVHNHPAPRAWVDSNDNVSELRPFRDWSVAKTLEDLDRGGVATAMLSITFPGHSFAEAAVARRVARACNDDMATMRRDHPGRFGVFAMLPMPDIAGTLAEIAYAYDTLKVDGVGLFTSYGNRWLGDTTFDPVFAELNRRKAVVYTHPTVNACCENVLPGYTTSTIEYGTDTSRAIAGYVLGGASQRFPDVKMIWSHAGGTMPYLEQRFVNAGITAKAVLPNGFLPEARKFYYDTAQVPSRPTMLALREIVPAAQILFGSDYPYRTFAWTSDLLAGSKVFSEAELRGIDRENALRLLPRAGA